MTMIGEETVRSILEAMQRIFTIDLCNELDAINRFYILSQPVTK